MALGDINPWMPEQDRVRLAMLGKLLEELGEATQRAARCITHGIYEIDPDKKTPNHVELAKELTDVEACMTMIRAEFPELRTHIARFRNKCDGFATWHDLIREHQDDEA